MSIPRVDDALERFLTCLRGLSGKDHHLIWKAFTESVAAHKNQDKYGGLYPYIIHPISVFAYLFDKEYRNRDLLIAALLHDTVEDSGLELSDIEMDFGYGVMLIVSAVTFRDTVPENETEEDRERRKREFFRQNIATGQKEAQLLGLADKLDNIRKARLIPQNSPHRKKFPRWIREAEDFLELAKSLNVEIQHDLESAIRALKRLSDDDQKTAD